jgi:hypothetical protein
MLSHGKLSAVLVLLFGMSVSAHAQLPEAARFSIIGTLIATEGAARIPMPLGKNGVELSENGLIAKDKLQKEISNNGSAISPGRVVSITAIDFSDKEIEFELNHGGTKKKGILSRIQIGVGGASTSQPGQSEPPAVGSKIVLKFAEKISPNLTAETLKDLLNPVLDFTKQSTVRAGIEALPPEFQDAVAAKEARVGMDANTVLLALGQPNQRIREKNEKGVEQEDWIYTGRTGRKQLFVTFEKDVVVEVTQY